MYGALKGIGGKRRTKNWKKKHGGGGVFKKNTWGRIEEREERGGRRSQERS